ncbi:hypothetical protein [Pseudomonas phage HJ01]|uniref:Uncharacterized protein n=7 Tax=Viruses TaxID=10239 RepID=A0AAF0FWG4_9CAUD|nr:hypothetical protein PaP1_gp002 [Pseudomonas phage PaP1]YP_008859337.1 hypothetical protein PAK_P400126 [Pseudomonas phage PAK_P4]YP_010764068.1 hypothetical protein QE337_gp002 [Pseudomonas phage HJ01]YP_010764585.1 hypothetical protein QE343_gp086 [Pseudomonas phage YS35]YP_010764655.1 PAP2 family protein [Pseudomonas phage vB_PaeM_B55]YP_010764845.1 hypothetical protein QE345_gp129 [Pseudomonas phage vB_PA45_GUMS]KEH08769.1 hypothetical protein GY14_17995 [Delftia tsuruhatensis]KEH1297
MSEQYWYPSPIGCIKSLYAVALEAWARDFWNEGNLSKILRHNGFSPCQSMEKVLQYMDQINEEYCNLMMNYATREYMEEQRQLESLHT